MSIGPQPQTAGFWGWLKPVGRMLGVIGNPGPRVEGPFPKEPKEVYGSSNDEKMASGPRAVLLPWFLPFFDDQSGETNEMRLAYRQMIQRCPVTKGAMLGKIFGVAALDIKITPVSDDPGDIEVAEFIEWSFNERI